MDSALKPSCMSLAMRSILNKKNHYLCHILFSIFSALTLSNFLFELFSKVSDQFHHGPRLMKNKNDISLRCLNVPTEAPPKSLIIDDVKT